MLETEAMGSALASWDTLIMLLAAFGVAVAVLFALGRGPLLLRIPSGLERVTGLPAWAAGSIGTSLFGLLVAGEGFYSDVAWHIALGRDEELFTAPHASIVIGLGLIFVSSAIGVLFATLQEVDTQLRIGALRVPHSMIPLALLGGSALMGFPLDELWHQQYGVDVTMWSPTHMLMILGASFSGMASWLVLAEARVAPTDSRWARGVHVVAGWLTLMGLCSAQGEFDFGVPQFQQMFHPVLVTAAGAFALVAIRIVHGRGWTIGIVTGSLLFDLVAFGGDSQPVATRSGGLFIVSALVVEALAWRGTQPLLRFAVLAGVGVATIGLAAEWVWNLGAHQPWHTSLLPDALVLCVLVGAGAAVLGAAFGSGVRGERPPIGTAPLAAAGLAVVLVLALPMPRTTGEVIADIEVEQAQTEGEVLVRVSLEPPDAADDARWFQTISWQGGGLQLAEMEEVAPGEYVADRPVKADGQAKAMVRLHRGGELMSAPVYLPDDPEIGEPEIPAEDRVVPMTGEAEYLLRETKDGAPWFSYVIYALLVLVATAWVWSFVLVLRRVSEPHRFVWRGRVTSRHHERLDTAAVEAATPLPCDAVGSRSGAGGFVTHDVVLAGGRVIDPETGFDRVCDVGIDGDSITAIGDGLEGETTVDVGGLVVAPGFVDLHSHAQTLPGRRLQACDGVTTALDLEAGRAPVEIAYEREAMRGSPINYGFSASWAAARMHVVADAPLDGSAAAVFGGLVGTEWQQAASATQVGRILDQISTDLAAGAIGVGVLIGYTPGVDPSEYLAIAELAAAAGVPTFTHSRDIVELAPETLIDGAEEVVRAAGTTGAHMHYCHINSTSGRHIDRVLALVDRCQAEGAPVTTEAYPYGSGSTAIGAAFLAPERLRERFRDTTSITYLPTGERVADDDRLRELRATDPGGLVIAEFLDESHPEDAALLRRSLELPGAIVASDAMPPLWTDTAHLDVTAWPLPPEAVTHPRTAGTFGRALRLWRQEGAPLMEALRRATLLPAEVLQDSVPAMRRKGRVRAGTDADLVVFEEAGVTDQATYAASTRPSSGIAHVIVGGTFVVRDGALVPDALPGRPVRASPR